MSHHFDSPTALEDGRTNLSDLYAFPGPGDTTNLILTINPDAGRSSPTTLRPDAQYEFVIASDGGTIEDRATRIALSVLNGSPLGGSASPHPVVSAFPHLAPADHRDLPALLDMFGLRPQGRA